MSINSHFETAEHRETPGMRFEQSPNVGVQGREEKYTF
jgi:hypothetical protein